MQLIQHVVEEPPWCDLLPPSIQLHSRSDLCLFGVVFGKREASRLRAARQSYLVEIVVVAVAQPAGDAHIFGKRNVAALIANNVAVILSKDIFQQIASTSFTFGFRQSHASAGRCGQISTSSNTTP